MAGVYKTKKKEEVIDAKCLQKCQRCKKDSKAVYRLHTMNTKVFCSETCIGQYFNGAIDNFDSFKIG